MSTSRIAGAVAALALLSAPAVATAHDHGDRHGRQHHQKHHARDAVTGTISSYAGGELTIALPSGRTFTALVTARTVLKCRTSAPATASTSRHADHGDDRGKGRCGTDALVAGAKVTQAKLSLKGGDATWKKVELLE